MASPNGDVGSNYQQTIASYTAFGVSEEEEMVDVRHDAEPEQLHEVHLELHSITSPPAPAQAPREKLRSESGCVEQEEDTWLSCGLPHLTFYPLMAAVLLCVLFVIVGRSYLEQLLTWLEDLSPLGNLLVFTLLFTLISFPFGCGYVILNMAAGYVHGFVEGQVLVVVTVAIGFSVAFLLCRTCMRFYAQNKVSSRLLALMRVVEGPHGFKVIMLTRLTPIPFGMQNTLFAMTSITYVRVLCASVIGLLPTQILNTYVGSTLRSIREVLTDRADAYILLSFQIIISVLLTIYLVRKAKIELSKMNNFVDVEKTEADRVAS